MLKSRKMPEENSRSAMNPIGYSLPHFRIQTPLSTLPPDHPPIPTTSTAQFPTRPPPACPMSQLAQTRPNSPNAKHPYAGEVFTLGTRNSKLAMVQTETVRRELQEKWPGCEIRILGMTTLGDNVQTQPLYTFGGKALWTKELEVALLESQVDAIVHCLKDVPTEFPPGCQLGAVLEREDPLDALVVKEGLSYTSLDEMPEGSVIGTSSVRRVAQLRRKYPGLKFADVRGNLGTRLRKLDDPSSNYTALILASAGLLRLSLGNRITASIGPPVLYPAVGQGALAIEIRQGDERSQEIIGSLECWKTSWMTRAERMMLKVLEGGCSVPVGCETKLTQVWVKGGEGDAKENRVNGTVTPQVHVRSAKSNGGGYFNLPSVNGVTKEDNRLIIPSPHICPHHDTQTSLHHATLTLTGTITSLSGTHSVISTISRKVHSVDDCEALGRDVALELIEGGGKEILTELGRHVKEVGGDELDGRPIPTSIPSPTPAHPMSIPIHPANHSVATDQVLEHMQAVSPPSASNGYLSKSPKSVPKVFRVGSGEKCLRPQGW
ncbi:hydroxymethylbilane synthase [Sporobolomyces koalae]|uniref:hydroxymethylbilane synthase n=1 Tax=Sporobolomyces koalae TaxID=500713 RepID=UPI003178847F